MELVCNERYEFVGSGVACGTESTHLESSCHLSNSNLDEKIWTLKENDEDILFKNPFAPINVPISGVGSFINSLKPQCCITSDSTSHNLVHAHQCNHPSLLFCKILYNKQ